MDIGKKEDPPKDEELKKMIEESMLEREAERAKDYEIGEVVALTDDGGVTKEILVKGTGEKPPIGSHVKVHYVGTLDDGTEFDSSRKRDSLFEFDIGKGNVIKAWDIGVAEMRTGEKAILKAKPEYAYGASGAPPTIPANASLTFEVELFDFEEETTVPENNLDKFKLAEQYKLKGNDFYGEKNLKSALVQYNKAADLLGGIWGAPEEEKKTQDKLNLSVHLNIAQVYLKQQDYHAAWIHANKALDVDDANVKALYRRGVALNMQGNYEDAQKDLEHVLSMDPGNKPAKTELQKVKKAVQAYKQKEKRMMKKMFQALHEDEPKEEKKEAPEEKKEEKKEAETDVDEVPKLEVH